MNLRNALAVAIPPGANVSFVEAEKMRETAGGAEARRNERSQEIP